MFKIKDRLLNDAIVIESFSAADNRGSFVKCFEADTFHSIGIDFSVTETFLSTSSKNVIRGMHFQLNAPQAKLVSVSKGSIFDVVIDLRKGSTAYGKWAGVELTESNHLSLLIPRGFAHGFLSLEDDTIVLYQCDGKYDKETDTGIKFDDPDVGIEWNVELNKVICSERDRGLMTLEDFDKQKAGF
jgi:dTDP-4-dehydrorhamnose 3,5-epimerase